MGLLIEGKWHDQWYDTKSSNGEFIRTNAQFRNWITDDGAAGITGESGFKAESGRYHLYVSLACPWAHRTLIFRKLKQLEEHISCSVVSPDMLENGWNFISNPENDGGAEVRDHLFNTTYYYEIYLKSEPQYTGRVTVPVLWDKAQNRIVSNESAEIIRMLNSEFNHITGNVLDFYPAENQHAINEINQRIYDDINNGVYKAGFATSQSAYSKSVTQLFQSLDWVEGLLEKQRYLIGSKITEADWRLFTTLIRFDSVYVGHFKCNLKRIDDYPNLSNYLRELYQWSGIKDTVNFQHIKRHYYYSHDTINPSRIIPEGPILNYERAHNRHKL